MTTSTNRSQASTDPSVRRAAIVAGVTAVLAWLVWIAAYVVPGGCTGACLAGGRDPDALGQFIIAGFYGQMIVLPACVLMFIASLVIDVLVQRLRQRHQSAK